jgi:hypothetical protein
MKSTYYIEALVEIYEDDNDDGTSNLLEELGINKPNQSVHAKMIIDCSEVSSFIEMKGDKKGWTEITTYMGANYMVKIPYKEMFGIVSSINPIKSFL